MEADTMVAKKRGTLKNAPDGTQTIPGPDINVKITEAYARIIAKTAYFWAWPLVNCYNRTIPLKGQKDIIISGAFPQAPLNSFGMLTGYVEPDERIVTCPNQDVVYGGGFLALDKSPAVVQVPDFGERFWLYQAANLRTDGFAQFGSMYGTKPGFYLIVGPNWNGEIPAGITTVFRCSSNTGMVGPRIFMDDTPEDRKAVQPVLKQVMMYPLSNYDGKMKSREWSELKKEPAPYKGEEEIKWVVPENFFDELPTVLADAPPLAGEEAQYAQILAVIEAATKDPKIKAAIVEAAKEADEEIVAPLFEFRNYGIQLPYHWSTVRNGAAFGTDYYARTAVAKSNMFVNTPEAAQYFYQDLDADGVRLNNRTKYAVTFAKDKLPPVNGFWSLTIYNKHHFFEVNELNRYSLGTKNKNMKYNPDGSLTIYVQLDAPAADLHNNWLPTPKSGDFSLFLRAYAPKNEALDGTWTPPAVVKIQ